MSIKFRVVDAKLGRLLCLLMGIGFYIAGFVKVSNTMLIVALVLHLATLITDFFVTPSLMEKALKRLFQNLVEWK